MTIESSRTVASPSNVRHNRGRRRRYLPCLLCLLLLLVLALTAVILAVTVFRPRDPRTKLVSANVTGISPRVSFPALQLNLNVTLELELSVYNPNYASFSHVPGESQLYYRGAQVGEADVAQGRIPSRGTEHVHARLTVLADRFAAQLGTLVGDVMAGEVGFDTRTLLRGRVTFLGFIRRHAVATSECHVAIGFPDLKVRSQQCNDKTKL